MALSKEYILTLSCLKEVGVKGIGPKSIFAIGEIIKSKSLHISKLETLVSVMKAIDSKAINSIGINSKGIGCTAINSVVLSDLEEAYQVAKKIIKTSEANQIGLVGYYDEEYPEILRQTINEEGKNDPPLLLWYRGDLSIAQMPGLAVIGTREVTPEGVVGGEFLAGEFAKRGFNIISGLAIGCDTCGHRGALKVGGKTTVFLANGLDTKSIYPAENQQLAEDIVANGGLLLSEYPIGTCVNRYSLVARDRLQAGLAQATLVIQTGIKGGTMHAAITTLKAGKPLYTMLFKNPETNNHEKCQGNAYLVRQGAKYIKGGDDLDEISEKIKATKQVKTTLF
jgi:DNA processing protein